MRSQITKFYIGIMLGSLQIFFLYLIVLVIFVSSFGLQTGKFQRDNNFKEEPVLSRNRKLLIHGGGGGGGGEGFCTNRDISISQSRDSSSGIPQYIVQIVNTCMSGCAPSNIHLRCGWFASARIVNPKIFKRIAFDDCLVNEGRPLKTSQIIRFTYSNSFMYPLSFKSARFCG